MSSTLPRPIRGRLVELGLSLGHREAVLVQGLAGDHAGEVHQPQVAQRAQVLDRAHAAGPDQLAAHGVGDAPDLVGVHALEHPVAVGVGVHEALGALGLQPLDQLLGQHLGLARPAGHRHPAAAHVHAHEHAHAPGGQRLLQELGVGVGGGAHHHALGAGGQRLAHRAQRAQAAAVLHGHAQLGGDALQVVQVRRLALARAVQVHHVQVARAGLDEGAGGLQRVVGVHRLVLEAALAQAHRLAVADVHRGQQDHAGDRRGQAGEVAQQRQPVGPGLLGVELGAEHVVALHHRRELGAVGRPRPARPRRARGGPRRSARGRRRTGSDRPAVRRRLAPPGHRAPADVRDRQPGRVQRLDRALQQADALGAAVLGGALEQQLHAHADADHRHPGVARARAPARRRPASAPAPSPAASPPRRAARRRPRRAPRRGRACARLRRPRARRPSRPSAGCPCRSRGSR